MQEFLEIQRHELNDSIKEAVAIAVSEFKIEQTPIIDDNIGVKEAMKLTGLKEKTIYSKVSRLEMPSLTRGRPLMFSRIEILDWLKHGKPSVVEIELKRRKGEL